MERGLKSNMSMAKKSELFDEEYSLGKLLGSGMTGTVNIVTHKHTNTDYAMKTINLDRIDRRQLGELRNEIQILKHLDHPNIVKLIETYDDKKHIRLIMEICVSVRGG